MPIACRSAQKIINCLEFYARKEISEMKSLIIHRLYIRDGQKYSDVMFFPFLFIYLFTSRSEDIWTRGWHAKLSSNTTTLYYQDGFTDK